MLLVSALILTACSGGGSTSSRTSAAPVGGTPPATPQSNEVSISGEVSFEDVGVDRETFTLDLADLTLRPARGIEIEAVNADGSVITSTTTDAAGRYSVTVPINTNVRIQATARILQEQGGQGGQWDIAVLDNTNERALYVVAGSLTNSGTNASTRNLIARSGSNGSSQYTGVRASGPFAILDTLYDAVTLFERGDPNIVFPDAQVFWSVNNRRVGADNGLHICWQCPDNHCAWRHKHRF